MKKIYTIICCIVSILAMGQVPTAGLVGAWPFNGNASDASPTANNGVVVGATLTFDRCGNANSAYSFNGTSNYIQMPLAGPTGAAARSLSFWAKTTNTTVNSPRSAFAYGSTGANATFQIMINNCGQGVGIDAGTQSLIRGGNCVLNNDWHHIVVIFNPAVSVVYSNISFYVDGVLQPGIVCSTGLTSIINTGLGSAITIGRSSTSAIRFWQGDLDDFYLYNRAITTTEVAQLYNDCPPPVFGNTMVCTGSAAVYSVAPIRNATYVWTLPGGWTGTSTTNTISATVNSAGSISVAVSSSCGALGTSVRSVSTLSLPAIALATTNTLLCAGSTVTLSASGANTYTWAPTVSTNSFLITTPSVTTTYTVRGRNTISTCTNSAVFTQSVIVSTMTVTAAGSGSIACSGSSATLTASGASNYTWQPGALSGTVVSVAPPTTRNYTVSGIAPSGCTATTTALVPVAPVLTLNISASSASACPGTSVILTASVSGGTLPYGNYVWTNGPSTNTNSVTQVGGGNSNYTVTVIDGNNCPVVRTNPVFYYNPINFIAPNVSVCPGSTATITVSGAQTYTWFPGSINGTSVTLIPAATTGYTIQATSVNGCTASTTVSASLKPVPSLSVLTKTITCASLGSASVTAVGGAGPFSYLWTPSSQTNSVAANLSAGNYSVSVFDFGTGCTSFTNTAFAPLVPLAGTVVATNSLICNGLTTGTAGIVLTGTSSLDTYTWTNPAGAQTQSVASLLGAGIHSVTVFNPITSCFFSTTFQITQPQPVVLNIFPSTTIACVSSTPNIILSAINSGGTGPHTYSWTNGPNTSFYATTQPVAGLITYSVNSRDINSCPGTASIALQFVAYPSLQTNTVAICKGSAATLTVSGAASYSWYPGGFTGSSVNYFPVSYSVYTVVGSTLGCSSTVTTAVFVNALPVAGIISNNNICEGLMLGLTGSGNGSYQWVGPSNFSGSGLSASINSVTLNNAGVYSLIVTDNKGCTASASTLIVILSNPVISSTGASVCAGESATLNVSGGSFYAWVGPGGFTSTLPDPRIPVVNTSGSYTVFVTGSNGCVSSAEVPVVAFPYALPTPTIITNRKTCLNAPLNLKGLGGDSYLWQGPNNLSSINQNLNFLAEDLNMSGIYTLTVKNTSNCAASTTVMVTVLGLPHAVLQATRNDLCVPFCSQFTINVSPNNPAPLKTAFFVKPDGTFSDSLGTLCFDIPVNRTLTVLYTDTNTCVNSSSLVINARPRPVADFAFDPPQPKANKDMVYFTNLSSSTPVSEWTWIFEANNKIVKERSPSHIFEKGNHYPVVLLVKNQWGCSDTVIKVVIVENEMTLYVPNVFTPNNDGKNDVFQPTGLGIDKFDLTIYDAWGHKVFNSTDISKAWDGTVNGEPAKFETYIWTIEVTSVTGDENSYEGRVTVLR